MKRDLQQELAIELMNSGENVFLTGMAGTGKSRVIQQFFGAFTGVGLHITATTGIAALNIQNSMMERTGILAPVSTVFRWAGIGIGPRQGQSFDDFYAERECDKSMAARGAFARVRSAKVLVIDEISMLPGAILAYLDFHCRRARGVDGKPFGGIQVIAVGDFLQLPPVAKTGSYDWAFMSHAWAACGFKPVYLHTIHRQDEPEFVETLNAFREGKVRGELVKRLQSRVAKFPCRDVPRLFTHNAMVDKWNAYSLGCIEAHDDIVFEARGEGPEHEVQYLINNLTTPVTLTVRVGARVMLTANGDYDTERGGKVYAANGQTGTVRWASGHGDSAAVRVLMDGMPEPLVIAPRKFMFDPTRKESGRFIQLPLRLAYALTIHKSQGLTLDRALIDIRAAREPGQAYVALSRVRTMGGLLLKDVFQGVFVSPEAVRFYREIAA